MPFVKGETPKGAKLFEKGKSGNPGGRPKGVKKQVKDLLTKYLPDIEKQIEAASPEEKVKLLSSLAGLISPIYGQPVKA